MTRSVMVLVTGTTHADHEPDHDAILNGTPDRIDVRQNIPKGGESRVIDLRGTGKRSIRSIEFWYDTKGFLTGKANVTVFGMH